MYNRRLVFTAACLGMLVFGIVMTTLGAILPDVIVRFGIDKAAAGSLFLLMSFGIMIGSVAFGPIADRFGFKTLLAVCTTLVLLGLEGIALAPSMGWMRIAVFFIGIGGGVLNGAANALVADISVEGRSAGLSILGIFFGVGAFGIPFMLGFLLDVFTYSTIIAWVGGLVLIPIILVLAIRFPEAKQAGGFPLKEGIGLTKETTLLLFGLMLFLQSGMEITVGGWTSTYFNEVLDLDPSDAVFFLSLFWAGMVLARMVLGGVLRRVSPALVLQVFIGLTMVGALMMLLSSSLVFATPGIFLIGAGLAAGFPIVLGYVGDLYSRLSGTAFSIVLVIALTGGSLLPWLAGIIGEAFGLRASFLIVPIGLVLMLGIFRILLRRMSASRGTTVAAAE